MSPLIITGSDKIQFARVLALKARLGLEIKGLRFRGRSAYSILKSELGMHGSREKVYADLQKAVDEVLEQ